MLFSFPEAFLLAAWRCLVPAVGRIKRRTASVSDVTAVDPRAISSTSLSFPGFVVFRVENAAACYKGLCGSKTTVPSALLEGVSCQYGCCQTDKAERQIIRL